MGNNNSSNNLFQRNSNDYMHRVATPMATMAFHQNHSSHITLSSNRHKATRIDSFCQGICYGDRPLMCQETVHIMLSEVSSSWNGVLRVGVTSHNPKDICIEALPRYVCPDLTNLSGYWARGIPTNEAKVGSVLSFRVTRSGMMMYSVDGVEAGVFLDGISESACTSGALWPLVDIYGNTVAVKFVSGVKVYNNMNSSGDHNGTPPSLGSPEQPLSLPANGPASYRQHQLQRQQLQPMAASTLVPHGAQAPAAPTAGHIQLVNNLSSDRRLSNSPQHSPLHSPMHSLERRPLSSGGRSQQHHQPHHHIQSQHHHQIQSQHQHHQNQQNQPQHHQQNQQNHIRESPSIHDQNTYAKLRFHTTIGRNICLSPDHTIAIRLKHEFCSGYVFSERPILPGETFAIQILAVVPPSQGISEAEFGGLTFGMTSCDPAFVSLQELPDDSDFLLDRGEYWVVNKDVNSTRPSVGDCLTFGFTTAGEIIYSKNSRCVGTLMHVDHTLPLWMFFDVYGNTQKVKSLGIKSSPAEPLATLTVALPPSRPPQRPPSLPPKEYNSATLRHQSSFKRATLPPPLTPTPAPPNRPPSCLIPNSTTGSSSTSSSSTPTPHRHSIILSPSYSWFTALLTYP